MLVGQNVNSYGNDLVNSKFSYLLNEIVKIKGLEKIEFMSSNPWDFSEELIKVISKNKNISRVIHLPVQSGDDEILKKMNRNYTVRQYLSLIKKIRKCDQLIEDGGPEKVATFFMFKNPDFLDLKTRDIYYTYQYAISRGVTKTAAAVIASTDYFGRGGEGALDLIISNYFTQRALYGCSTNLLDIDFLRAIRYKKLYRFPEARLAFSAIGDFEDMLGDYD